MNYYNLIFLTLFVLVCACNEDEHDSCTDEIENISNLEIEYGCINTKYQMNITLLKNYMIITNQTDFLEVVTGTCQPEIDFSIYDLIIGKKGFSSGNSSIDYKLISNCKNKSQKLIVTFHQNANTEAPELTYHALVPKLEDQQNFSVEMITK